LFAVFGWIEKMAGSSGGLGCGVGIGWGKESWYWFTDASLVD
jgi:hypothetical protein